MANATPIAMNAHPIQLPTRSVPYASKDAGASIAAGGGQITFDLNKVNALVGLTVTFKGGALPTSDYWLTKETSVQSGWVLAITHYTLKADNTVLQDQDCTMLVEQDMLDNIVLPYAVDGSSGSTGTSATTTQSFFIPVADYDEKLSELAQHTALQTWRVTNLQLTLTINNYTALSHAGSTSGITASVLVSEEVIDRSLFPKIQQILVKRLQTQYPLTATGDNSYDTLPRTGAIKKMLIFVGGTSAGASASDALVDEVSIIRNSTDKLFDKQWLTMKQDTNQTYGIKPDAGNAMIRFVKHGNYGQALKTNDTEAVRALSFDFHTASAPSSQNIFFVRTEYSAV